MTGFQRAVQRPKQNDFCLVSDSAQASLLGRAIRVALMSTAMGASALPLYGWAADDAALVSPIRNYAIPAGPLDETLNQGACGDGVVAYRADQRGVIGCPAVQRQRTGAHRGGHQGDADGPTQQRGLG